MPRTQYKHLGHINNAYDTLLMPGTQY